MGAHHHIRPGGTRIGDQTGTAGATLGRSATGGNRAIAAKGDGEGRRKAASGYEGEKERSFRHGKPN